MIRRIVNFNIDANQISNTMLSYQGEHLATELRIHLPEKLLSSDCTYKLLFYLPNGEAKYAVLEYTKRYLKFLIPQALTMLSGSIKVQLIITDNDNTIIKSRTQSYTIVPSSNVTTKEVDDKYIGLLDGKIREINKALETAIAQAKNAYQIAVENGFVGTEEDWLESLKGQDYVLTENDRHEIAEIAIANIADGDEVYTVEEADEHFLSKYDAGNIYATKAELVTKANKETTYTKAEVDTALSGKLDNTAGSVTTDNIASKAVTNEKIANGAITSLKLANNAVSGSNIAQNQIGTDHLQNGTVTSEKLADEVKESINGKADKATTIAGYGITDAYTKDEVEDLKAYIGYTDSDILGLQVDFENKAFTRLAGAVGLSAGSDFDRFAMYGGRKRCNVSDDGTITAYYGDEGFADDGSNGQVMVYQPKFYYKVVPLKLEPIAGGIGYHQRKTNFYISATPKAGFKLHPAFYDANGNEVDYILYSAYEGSMYDVSAKAYVNDNVDASITYEDGDLLCSVAGKKPISGLRLGIGTKSNLEQMAQNRGSGWHLETIKAASANQLLMMIELGAMNTQNGIGLGVVNIPNNASYNCSSLTGSTADLGNGTGQATSTVNEIVGTQTTYNVNGKVSVSYRGVENPWGNILKHIQGVNIWGDETMGGGQPYVANNFAFNESTHSDNYESVGFTLSSESGYISALGYGSEKYDWLFMPSEIGGTSALPVGDYLNVTQNLNGYRNARFGGNWASNVTAGGFYQFYAYGINNRTGGRLIYVPTAKV